ncbi:MAG: hypothetical protein EB072_14040, partial [Betaproteobacteria bacterium]|nr:hypothetical protein [Betaproteobacteria bacterium]
HQGGIAERRQMIDRSHKLSVSRQASLLGISRESVYYLPKPIGESDLRIMHAMDRLHLDFPFMGSRLLTRMLRQQGFQVGNRPHSSLDGQTPTRVWLDSLMLLKVAA